MHERTNNLVFCHMIHQWGKQYWPTRTIDYESSKTMEDSLVAQYNWKVIHLIFVAIYSHYMIVINLICKNNKRVYNGCIDNINFACYLFLISFRITCHLNEDLKINKNKSEVLVGIEDCITSYTPSNLTSLLSMLFQFYLNIPKMKYLNILI